ncbi:MAG TPA: hypothetical protein VN947_22830 [Polyangia bacterium]|nr:hypothetical protein [Polyangia bacterium]
MMRYIVAAALFGAACAPTKSAVRTDGRLAIACNVPDARVYVDDVFRGRAAELVGAAVLVPSGSRRVEVRADGWFTAYRDVVVPHDGRAAVDVALRPVPETEHGE